MKSCWVVLLFILLCVTLSCSGPTGIENGKVEPTPSDTPREDGEAELIALCLSGDLIAPESLYEKVKCELLAIRSIFGDDFEVLNRIEFRPPWVAGCLIVGFNDTTAEMVLEGEYHAWDELNEKYRLTEIDTDLIDWLNVAVLYFQGRLHPCRLAELYDTLPGVVGAGANAWGGDCPNIYARQTEDCITYLFRDAWEDCPCGCIYNEFWYFAFENDQPVLIGHWASNDDPEPPDWWDEAKKNWEEYCPCSKLGWVHF